MRSSRGSLKEPLGKKASGLGKLMSALHQNASSLVTTRSQHNGPNQVLPANDYLTSRRNASVKLRKEETGLGSEEPVSVPHLLQEISEIYPEVVAMKTKDTVPGEWKTWNYNQYFEDVQTIAKAFVETGLQRHHSVAIVGENSPEWVICNMAAIFAGGISVGVQTTMNPEDLAKVALDSKADIIVVDQEAQLKKVLLIQHKLPELKAIIQIHGEPSISDKRRLHRTHKKHILSWANLTELGQALQESRLEERKKRISINQCCTIAYSNGRNSAPKGVMYSHDNLTWSAKMALGFIRAPGFNKSPMPGEEILLSYLPFSHISTQIIDMFYLMNVAGTLVFPGSNVFNDVDKFFSSIKEVQPTILYGPPVIYERIFHRLIQMRRSVSGVERFFLDWTNSAVSQKHERSASPNGRTNKMGEIQHKIAKNTVCKKYKESLGLGPNTLYLCRGGTLQDRLLRYLAGFDIVVHTAYGQSEVTSFLAANIPKRFCKFSTAGKAVPGVKLKIEKAEDGCPNDTKGEVLGYGRNIFMGYLNKENENQNALTEEGWLRLGDQASLDEEGFLVVHGHKEDELLMLNGVVNPTQIEGNLRLELPCISSCLVISHGADRLGVLLSLDTEVDDNGAVTTRLTKQTVEWFRAARFDVQTIFDVIELLESGLKHVIQAGIDRANQLVTSSCHMITEWRVLPNSFSVSTGELGPTLQIRRNSVLNRYAEHINQMLTHEGRKHSFTDSIGGESYQGNGGGQFDRQPYQLHQIIEEEERSNRNSVDKEHIPSEPNNNRDTVTNNAEDITEADADRDPVSPAATDDTSETTDHKAEELSTSEESSPSTKSAGVMQENMENLEIANSKPKVTRK